ncbi:LamG-like jellyroll fold domain-containing protein [Streptomyces sp. NPDC008061]|uniref:LamG-like jellyroll fold domain-containing protein n=1 Tax=Streptomyces sp. NPDC008061 TaxID=3364805 RepID=UPI0036DFBC8C
MRSETSDVFATADGSLEAREYLRPVRARVAGRWKPIDTDLALTAKGAVAPKTAAVGLEFSGGGVAPLVRMTKAGRELALTWPGELPTPVLSGATATYRDVLPGVDLRMEAQETGYTQLLVVNSAEAAANPRLSELRLKLDAEGLDVTRTSEGGLQAVDKGAHGTVFEAPKPMMWDSSTPAEESPAGAASRAAAVASPAEGEEPAATESGKLAPVEVAVPAGGDELVLTPDSDVLRGEDTAYPVFIDPQFDSPLATAWTMASKYWASSPQWKFNGESTAGMGYCNWSYCQPNDTKRLFYQIPTSKFKGKTVLSAEFVVRNTWSASCSARSVELWRTKDISTSTTWNSQNASGFWIKELPKADPFAYGFDGCAAKDAEFNVKAAVQEAANGGLPTMTFGLRAASESDGYAWKRFSNKAFLRVKYNLPPKQVKMDQLTMEYGGKCKRYDDSPPRVRTLGKIYANGVTDPDGDKVAVQFQAGWDANDGKGNVARWKPALTTYKASGSQFSISLPASVLPKDKQINWYVRSYDGAQYSPWSNAGTATGCYFTYDTTAPATPTITSSEYPESTDDGESDPWFDGVGKYGTFQLKGANSDVTKYWYGINSDPSSKNTVSTSAGAAKSIKVLPAKAGLNFIMAQALDSSGRVSAPVTYYFKVRAGQPERASWQFDDGIGASQAVGSTPVRTAALHGGPTLGVEGVQGTAMQLDGVDDFAATDVPVLDTDHGFAVSAWVKLSRLPTKAAIIAAQPGNESPGFELYYSSSYERWVFNQYAADVAGAGLIRAMAPAPGGVEVGKWTHLVGAYDEAAKRIELYVDGQLVGQTALPSAWNARRGLILGAGFYSGLPANYLPGAIDDVQLFDRSVTAADVTRLHTHASVGDPGAPARTIFSLDDSADATEIKGRGGVLPAVFKGGVTTGNSGVSGTAAHFDGTANGYARVGQTSGSHVNTSRSFTVSAWAKLDAKPGKAAIIAAQAGHERPGFELYYSSAYDRWAFNQYESDTADASIIRAMQPDGSTARAGEWTHLVGVHDTVADTLTLYVNGVLVGTTVLNGAFNADQSMFIGAGSYSGSITNNFPGTIDDLRLYDRPVSAEEVQQIFRQSPVIKGRWQFEETTSSTPPTVADASPENRPMSLYGTAQLGSGQIDNSGLDLDGVGAYAATSTMPVDTGASFTMTAWARAAAVPDHSMAVMSAEGTSRSAFEVRFQPDPADPQGLGRWELSLPDKDSTTEAAVTTVSNTEFNDVTSWNHLAVVYDGFAKEIRLYVNGHLQDAPCIDADGDGEADNPDCKDLASWADDALSFKAAKSVQIGRAKGDLSGAYFAGSVDDVWAFQGALDESQIQQLAGSFFDIPTEVPSGNHT